MKIKEFAEERGLTQGAIYKAITRNRSGTRQITNKKGEITQTGLKILHELYPEDTYPVILKPEEASEALEEKERVIESLRDALKEAETDKSTIDEMRKRLSEAQERAEKWERLYLDLQEKTEQERQTFLEKIGEANRLVSQQQELARLASMNPIRRLFSGKKKPETQGRVD